MKRDPLEKLFIAAAKAQQPEGGEISPFLEQRILRSLSHQDREPNVIPVFRFGFAISMAVACLVVILTNRAEQPNPLAEYAETAEVATLTYYP